MSVDKAHISGKIKDNALALGFDAVGIAPAGPLEDECREVDRWLEQGFHGDMQWMERNRDKRKDPRLLVPGARSVVVVMMNYYTPQKQEGKEVPKISIYAQGKDYHRVLKDRLFQLLQNIRREYPEVSGRAFVDSAPVLERAWAVRAGLGWQGKNTLLIHKEKGSFLFLGELIIDLELQYDKPETRSYCGTCRSCLDACPTDALMKPGLLDAQKCISYLTIEKKGALPETFRGRTEGYVFGCDICQQVCPWNKKAIEHRMQDFFPIPGLLEMKTSDWLSISETEFQDRFSDSPLSRPGLEGIQRNVKALGLR